MGHKLEHDTQISGAVRSDTVRRGVPGRGHCIPESTCLKQVAIHVAASRMVDVRRRICDSHWARILSISELASQNGTSRRCVCCTWRICTCSRGEHPCTNGGNRQPELARPGSIDMAGDYRSAGICGRVRRNCSACPSATEPTVRLSRTEKWGSKR